MNKPEPVLSPAQHALACAQANSDALDWLLERRFRLSSEAL